MKAKLVMVVSLILFFGCASPSNDDDPNNAPTATSVLIGGGNNMLVTDTLTGSYVYNDAEGNTEGTSTYRWIWYADGDSSCTGVGTAITGATSKTYQLEGTDIDHYIRFEVTPVAATGTADGTAVTSACTIQVDP